MLPLLLTSLLLVPLAGCIACLAIAKKHEKAIFTVAISTLSLEIIGLTAFLGLWIAGGAQPMQAHLGALYSSAQYTFDVDLYFDTLTAVFLGMATLMTTLVLIYSKYYMHREQGFKRFFATILLFFTGLSLIVLSGNFEVLFVGWEIIGICSVLLIAFYRDRFLPGRNALKVFSVYRIADAFLLAAIWYAHHLFEKNVAFVELSQLPVLHPTEMALLGGLLLVAALIKSAQFPFSYWLPRAMEGPTTSSAIFYGALSVHMGLYILLRTFPLWQGSLSLRVGIVVLGLVTALVASSIARVQSSIKTQIAYASITQIGIMFIELAAGLHWLVLLHFVSNASLRTYQLLISPSIVGYLVHDQFFSFTTPIHKIGRTLLGRVRATVFVLGIKEWNMNSGAYRFVWRPLQAMGSRLAFVDRAYAQVLLLAGVAGLWVIARISSDYVYVVIGIAVATSIALYIRAYATKGSARVCWNLIGLGHAYGALFLFLASGSDVSLLVQYAAFVAAALVAGHACLWYLSTHGEPRSLRVFHGSMYAYPRLGHFFFIVVLLFASFPISPSFLAQDIMLSRIPAESAYLILFFCVSYLLSGVSIMRLYVKLSFGPHRTGRHEIAYTAS